MSLNERLRRSDAALQPVFDAIDQALSSGFVDTESLQEAVDSHIQWWVDEMAAMAHALGDGDA